jgi:predicted O-methyltransferase YrrM
LQEYVEALFAQEDAVLDGARKRSDEAGLPQIQVPPATGRLVQVLVRLAGAKRVLEVGSLGGYSAVWIARALPQDGTLLTLEREPRHAQVARETVGEAGFAERVEVREGEALSLLEELDEKFDVVFLDADKETLVDYLEHGARLLNPGGLLLADNALWRGLVVEPEEGAPSAYVDRFNRALAADDRFLATIVPVGDGVAVGVRV